MATEDLLMVEDEEDIVEFLLMDEPGLGHGFHRRHPANLHQSRR